MAYFLLIPVSLTCSTGPDIERHRVPSAGQIIENCRWTKPGVWKQFLFGIPQVQAPGIDRLNRRSMHVRIIPWIGVLAVALTAWLPQYEK
ncbi:MAG: hypothetical protein DSY90_08770 [Deltaproteobacteria bacterium]|nr:MAG: hypothetical protein DSY90_08770 [Deltaproteobacteria bacterium]